MDTPTSSKRPFATKRQLGLLLLPLPLFYIGKHEEALPAGAVMGAGLLIVAALFLIFFKRTPAPAVSAGQKVGYVCAYLFYLFMLASFYDMV